MRPWPTEKLVTPGQLERRAKLEGKREELEKQLNESLRQTERVKRQIYDLENKLGVAPSCKAKKGKFPEEDLDTLGSAYGLREMIRTVLEGTALDKRMPNFDLNEDLVGF